jgi:uncharacterized membrane protein YuzA (DUF378 family)
MWLSALRVYLVGVASMNLVWETLHLPLYTIWETGTAGSRLFAVVHCTGGDVLIALGALALALFIAGAKNWPETRFRAVALLTVLFGVAYTIFSEWLNVVVRASWAYSEMMPVVTLFGMRIGLSPLAQWLAIPFASLLLARRTSRKPA